MGQGLKDVDIRERQSVVDCRVSEVRSKSLPVWPTLCLESIYSKGHLLSSCQIDFSVSEVVVCCELLTWPIVCETELAGTYVVRARFFAKIDWQANNFSHPTFRIRTTKSPPFRTYSSFISDRLSLFES